MRYAIMSDAHANPVALEQSLADARRLRCGRFIFLGDISGYGYDVAGTLRLVRDNFDVVLMGNHDSACVGLESAAVMEKCRNYDLDALQRGELTDEEAGWLAGLGSIAVGKGIAFTHGSFVDPRRWRYVENAADAGRNFELRSEPLLFVAHTHEPAVWELTSSGQCRRYLDRWLRLPPTKPDWISFYPEEGSRYLVNVGSVGYPRDSLCTSYVVYDSSTGRVNVRRLPFAFSSYVERMTAAGLALPRWLAELLPPEVVAELAEVRRSVRTDSPAD